MRPATVVASLRPFPPSSFLQSTRERLSRKELEDPLASVSSPRRLVNGDRYYRNVSYRTVNPLRILFVLRAKQARAGSSMARTVSSSHVSSSARVEYTDVVFLHR